MGKNFNIKSCNTALVINQNLQTIPEDEKIPNSLKIIYTLHDCAIYLLMDTNHI